MSQVFFDDKKLSKFVDGLSDGFRKDLKKEVMQKTGLQTIRAIKDPAMGIALPKVTGTLRRSYQIVEEKNEYLRIDSNTGIGKRLEYADEIEFGAKAKTIKARKAKSLRFKPKGGKPVFTKSVRIPARKGQFNFRDRIQPFSQRKLSENLNKFLKVRGF